MSNYIVKLHTFGLSETVQEVFDVPKDNINYTGVCAQDRAKNIIDDFYKKSTCDKDTATILIYNYPEVLDYDSPYKNKEFLRLISDHTKQELAEKNLYIKEQLVALCNGLEIEFVEELLSKTPEHFRLLGDALTKTMKMINTLNKDT